MNGERKARVKNGVCVCAESSRTEPRGVCMIWREMKRNMYKNRCFFSVLTYGSRIYSNRETVRAHAFDFFLFASRLFRARFLFQRMLLPLLQCVASNRETAQSIWLLLFFSHLVSTAEKVILCVFDFSSGLSLLWLHFCTCGSAHTPRVQSQFIYTLLICVIGSLYSAYTHCKCE